MYQGTPSATPLYLQRPPLNPPHYGAGFGEAVKRAYSKAFVYEGRASRAEYWWFALFATLVNFPILIVLGLLMNADAPKAIIVLLWLIAFAATVIPAIALSVRRLHDTGRSGAFYLLTLVPFGSIVLLVFLAGETRAGPNPFARQVGGSRAAVSSPADGSSIVRLGSAAEPDRPAWGGRPPQGRSPSSRAPLVVAGAAIAFVLAVVLVIVVNVGTSPQVTEGALVSQINATPLFNESFSAVAGTNGAGIDRATASFAGRYSENIILAQSGGASQASTPATIQFVVTADADDASAAFRSIQGEFDPLIMVAANGGGETHLNSSWKSWSYPESGNWLLGHEGNVLYFARFPEGLPAASGPSIDADPEAAADQIAKLIDAT